MVQAIETRYAGCHFRSRLEARWAVFFDTLGIEWQYEPEAFDVSCFAGAGLNYLPDFYLPATQTWVEVKGSAADFNWEKIASAVDWGHLPHTFEGHDRPGPTTRGLLLLGPVPRPLSGHTPTFPLLQHDKGVYLEPALILDQPVPVSRLTRYNPAINLSYGVERFDAPDGWNERDERSEWVCCVKRVWPESEGWITVPNDSRVDEALRAARSARF